MTFGSGNGCQGYQDGSASEMKVKITAIKFRVHRMDGIGPAATSTATSSLQSDDDFNIKGAATRASEGGTKDQETCTICLEAITDRAVAVPCNHLTFDFLCLVSWLQEHSRCPLCNTKVTDVQYEFRGPEDFKTYKLPEEEASRKNESEYQSQRRRRGQDFIRRRARRWASESVEDPALETRRRVYRERLYALHVGANSISGYHDFAPADFARSSELQTKTRMFLRRELQIFTFLDTSTAPRGGNREFLLEYVVAILRIHEPKGASGHAEDMLADYLGRENARLLLHELEAWLRSPFRRLQEWDCEVQYDSLESTEDRKRTEASSECDVAQ